LVEQLICNQQVTGSSPVASSRKDKLISFNQKISCFFLFFYLTYNKLQRVSIVAHVAQLVEHFLGKEEVTGSNPVAGSTLLQSEFYGEK
jgi:hypothetical protein